MIVSATGDPSNVDNFTTGEVIEDWRLVPNDNNIAMRKVKFPPRLVTVIADAGDFGNVCLGSFKDMRALLEQQRLQHAHCHQHYFILWGVPCSQRLVVPAHH